MNGIPGGGRVAIPWVDIRPVLGRSDVGPPGTTPPFDRLDAPAIADRTASCHDQFGTH